MERPKDLIINDLNEDLSYLYESIFKLMADIDRERSNGDTIPINETLYRLSMIAKGVIAAQKDFTQGFSPDELKPELMELLDAKEHSIDSGLSHLQR